MDVDFSKSAGADRPFPIYESYVIDLLIKRGISGQRLQRLLAIHADRITNHYRAGFSPELCLDCLLMMDGFLQESRPLPSEQAAKEELPQSKAMRDTLKHLAIAHRNGFMV